MSAQSTALATAPLLAPPPAAGTSWFVLVVLTLLVVLVAVLVWFYKRRLHFSSDNLSIRVLGTRPLGAREQIVVAQVHGRILVLGHTPSQVSLLCELDPGELPDMPSEPTPSDFAKLMTRFVRKENGS